MTTREYLYRSAFELGRHLIGYEVQKVLAGIDWFEHEAQGNDPIVGVIGWGEGGMLALYAAALENLSVVVTILRLISITLRYLILYVLAIKCFILKTILKQMLMRDMKHF